MNTHLVPLLSAAVLAVSSPCNASDTSTSLCLEAMMVAQADSATALNFLFGPDNATTLHFSYNMEITSGVMQFTADPGQTYLGRALSLSSVVQTGGVAEWVTTGQLGADAWTIAGSAAWSGDPVTPTHLAFTRGGYDYSIDGTYHYDPNAGTGGGAAVLTGPAGGPYGAGILGTLESSSYFDGQGWGYTVRISDNPVTGTGAMIDTAGAFGDPVFRETMDWAGPGVFETRITTAVPEPGTYGLAAVAGLGLLVARAALRRRRVPAERA